MNEKEPLDLKRFQMGTKAEKEAVKLLNSNKLNHSWKKDFRRDNSTEDWDLINSENIKIEVKSTIKEYSYRKNHIKFNFPNQKKQIVMRLLLDDKWRIKEYKFLKYNKGIIQDVSDKVMYN